MLPEEKWYLKSVSVLAQNVHLRVIFACMLVVNSSYFSLNLYAVRLQNVLEKYLGSLKSSGILGM